MKKIDDVSGDVLDVALRIHRNLGPGLLESVYEAILAERLARTGYSVERQRIVDIEFEGVRFAAAFKADLIVDGRLVVEIKSVERLLAVPRQAAAYLSAPSSSARRAAHQLWWARGGQTGGEQPFFFSPRLRASA